MKILVAGIGAIGSNLVASLVPDLKGEHQITILDMDTVEERNVTPGTQFYTPDQVGLSKVEALEFNIYKNFQKRIQVLEKDIMDIDYNTLKTYDLIIDCFDNNRARNRTHMFKKLGEEKKTQILHAGFSDNFTFAIEWDDNYKVPTDITTGMDICEMPGAAAFANTVGSMGALVAEEFVRSSKKMDIVGGKFIHSVVK